MQIVARLNHDSMFRLISFEKVNVEKPKLNPHIVSLITFQLIDCYKHQNSIHIHTLKKTRFRYSFNFKLNVANKSTTK